jgi:hypothetical protein
MLSGTRSTKLKAVISLEFRRQIVLRIPPKILGEFALDTVEAMVDWAS